MISEQCKSCEHADPENEEFPCNLTGSAARCSILNKFMKHPHQIRGHGHGFCPVPNYHNPEDDLHYLRIRLQVLQRLVNETLAQIKELEEFEAFEHEGE